jgi:tetratricopeptide (TPR) repeat protein
LTGLEHRGLSGTAEHLRLAVTLMDTYLDLGQLLHASALAEQLIRLADELADPQRQSAIYLAGARLAEARGGTREAVELAERALSRLDDTAADGPSGALEAARLRLAAASCLLRRAVGNPPGHRPGHRPGHPPGHPPGHRPDGGTDGGPDEVGRGPATAVKALEASRAVLDARGTPEDRSRWAVQRALADLALAEPVAAEVNARRALAQLSERQRRPVTVEAQLVLGDALRAQNRHAHADAAHEQAARALAALPEPRWRPWSAGVWRSLGDRWLARGCCDRAADAYRRALDADGLVASRPAPA